MMCVVIVAAEQLTQDDKMVGCERKGFSTSLSQQHADTRPFSIIVEMKSPVIRNAPSVGHLV